eukprot:gnl/Spiro4/3900_TR1931_c0_g1_i1.p1 gnl/Spiro4/3900_TR1931_c0_g1~~gnl/Spiro4/3900_TR1931_c0_g1_i1.p1  ORF type:complete len:663 (+),score=182.49 gnl/Spiro4/3900_TR1931_c0_g1_i1:74-2062(+)
MTSTAAVNRTPHPELTMRKDFKTVVVVGGIPKVGEDKIAKLKQMLEFYLGQKISCRLSEVYVPKDRENPGGGYCDFCFVEYETPGEAKRARLNLHEKRFDKSHVLTADFLEDLDRVENMPDTYTPPTINEYESREFLHHWLLDNLARDQFVIRHGDDTSIYWMQAHRKPELVLSKPNWTDNGLPCMWTPRGTYLATFHLPGVQLWGSAAWDNLGRFPHPAVKVVEFSPCESFMVTYSPANPEEAIIVWEVRSGRKIRSFPDDKPNALELPLFHWSPSEKYFGRMVRGVGLNLFDTTQEGAAKLTGKMIRIEGIHDFCWSPDRDMIAYWVPEKPPQPAKVTLLSIPDMTVVRNKKLVDITDCAMHWHPSGDFLCVKVDQQKTKKITVSKFEIFRMRERDYPVEAIDLGASPVLAFAWEPKGCRFAIVHGETPRVNVSFYEMLSEEKRKGGLSIKQLKMFSSLAVNHLFWSPRGNDIVLAGLKNLNGILYFIDTNTLEILSQGEHMMCTEVEWDPTGRFVCTSTTNMRASGNNEFMIWNFQGKLIHRIMKERFFMILWRPRPPSLLSAAQEEHIRKNFKTVYEPKYKEMDRRERFSRRTEARELRTKMEKDFNEYLARMAEQHRLERPRRLQLRGGAESDTEDEGIEVTSQVECVLSEVDEVLE